MTGEELISNFKFLQTDLPRFMSESLQVVLLDTKALVQRRIQETGKDANESELSPYSPEYRERKKREGKYRGFVDLSMTNDMWKSMGIIEASTTGSKVVITLGGRDDFSQNKIDWNSEKRGDILRLTKKEEEFTGKAFDSRLQEYLDTIFES